MLNPQDFLTSLAKVKSLLHYFSIKTLFLHALKFFSLLKFLLYYFISKQIYETQVKKQSVGLKSESESEPEPELDRGRAGAGADKD